jgi:hypothetical protein
MLAVLAVLGLSSPAYASLTTFQTFTGNVGFSSDGLGTTTGSGTISASVPVGATVLGAYLYQANFFSNLTTFGATLNGSAATFGAASVHSSGFLSSARADVTSIVAPIINGGAGGTYNFSLVETVNGGNDTSGNALVVVYSLASLPVTTVGILDGFSAFAGDTATITFGSPLDPTAPGFVAEMIIGDHHSCCSQASTIRVNGSILTQNAGNLDDGNAEDNSALITVGGFNDPFSPANPSYTDDHERYNLQPFIGVGNTSIVVSTLNPSADDNIFLEVFRVSGVASIQTTPEPTSLLLLGIGIVGVAGLRARRIKG